MADLKPCPFCGSAVDQEQPEDMRKHGLGWNVGCDSCGFDGPYGRDAAAAIAAWNRRHHKEGGDLGPGLRRAVEILIHEWEQYPADVFTGTGPTRDSVAGAAIRWKLEQLIELLRVEAARPLVGEGEEEGERG